MSAPEHPLLAALRDLERRDAELRGRIEELTQLEADIAELRTFDARVSRFRRELPAARESAAADVRAAETELQARENVLRSSEAELAGASDPDAAARARATAATVHADAEKRLRRVRGDAERLDREAASTEAEAERVAERARSLARGIGVELRGELEPWAARARAKVFAERTHAEGERQRIQTEASELAAAVTGEPLVGDVRRIREAVEAAARR